MSRADLDHIQAQLKVAIQSHQILVAKMKNDPQNPGLQKQLHELQTRITSLSDRQKNIVQLLRKELVCKQQATPSMAHPPAAHQVKINYPPAQMQATNLSLKIQSAPQPAHNYKPRPAPAHQAIQPRGPVPQTRMPSHRMQTSNRGGRSGSPLIRVPHYPVHRPSILLGASGTQQTHRPTAPKVRVPTVSTPTFLRKPSDSDINSLKRSAIDKKTLTPEERKKMEFMNALDLITPDTLKELNRRRSERKRRSTANPHYSWSHFEPERKKAACYLSNVQSPTAKRKVGRPPKTALLSQAANSGEASAASFGGGVASEQVARSLTTSSFERDSHEDYCAVCHTSGELLMCDTCTLVYHLHCLDPPMVSIPQGIWSCPQCKVLNKHTNNNWPGTMQLVHSYLTHKAAKEEEKKKLQKRQQSLQIEKSELDGKNKTLSDSVNKQLGRRADLLNASKDAQQTVDKLKNFIKVFQS